MIEATWIVAILLGYSIGTTFPIEDIIDFYHFQQAKRRAAAADKAWKKQNALSKGSETAL